jgi:hypothetical protein
VIAVSGLGAPPRVALDGPGSASVPASGSEITRGDGYMTIPSTADNTTYVVLAKPRAGRWSVVPAAGSAPVTGVRSAAALPSPSVTAKVIRGNRLRYTVKPIPGQTVRLRELGPNVSAPIGVLRGRSGTLRFKPAFGRGGVRRIVADVLQNDAARTSLTVARYRAPAPRVLAAPRRVSARLHGDRLSISWPRVRGATSYVASVWTTDGRELMYEVRGRTATVKHMAGFHASRIVVRAVRADGALGRPGTLR